jgi:prepilin-type N-terminal cleavage/methylation domain-containing protein
MLMQSLGLRVRNRTTKNCEPRTKNHTRGFTLVEIMIVVVIIVIAAMTVVPMFSSAASIQIGSAANVIAADLEYAKSMAISRGQDFSVVFDKTSERYQIEDQDGAVIAHPVKKGFDYVVDFLNDRRLGKVNIDDVDFASTSEVKFDCLGSPDNGGVVSLEASGITMTVTVEPVTGFISISE